MRRTPVHFVVAFLKYLNKRKLDVKIDNLLKKLLPDPDMPDDEFMATLCRTPADCIVNFLEYLHTRKLITESDDLLRNLLRDGTFRNRITYIMVDKVVPLLRHLDQRGWILERDNLLTLLLRRESDARGFLERSPNHLAGLINYLGEIGRGEAAQQLIDCNYGQLSASELSELLSTASNGAVSGLLVAMRNSMVQLPSDLYLVMIRKLAGPFAELPKPDPEYPQEILVTLPIHDLVKLLANFNKPGLRYKMNCIVESLISDESTFLKWMTKLSHSDLSRFYKAAFDLRFLIRIPATSRTMIEQRLNVSPYGRAKSLLSTDSSSKSED